MVQKNGGSDSGVVPSARGSGEAGAAAVRGCGGGGKRRRRQAVAGLAAMAV